MAATVSAYQQSDATGATLTKVDSVGGTAPIFGTDDAVASSTPIQIPTSTGTNFACFKNFFLDVTATAATTISNRKISMAASPSLPTGVLLWFKANTGAYVQGSAPTAGGTDGATPTGYTGITTTGQVYDSSAVSAGSTGKNGGLVQVTVGIASTYTGGGGSLSLPNLQLSYDEA